MLDVYLVLSYLMSGRGGRFIFLCKENWENKDVERIFILSQPKGLLLSSKDKDRSQNNCVSGKSWSLGHMLLNSLGTFKERGINMEEGS